MSDQAKDDPGRHYDRITEAWAFLLGEDLHYGYFDAPDLSLERATQALTGRMAEAAALEPGLEILDVGCGTGKPACHLAAERGCKVVGISTSETGLARARERAAAAGMERLVRFECRDGTDNDFPDESFDRVWVMESSHLMPDKERLVAECARVLRPGGRVTLCDIVRKRELPLAEVLRHAKAFDLLRRVYGRAKMESLNFYAERFRDSGLEVETLEDITEPTRPTFDHWRRNARRWQREVEERTDAQYLASFRESCDVLDGFFGDETLGYGLIAGRKANRCGGSAKVKGRNEGDNRSETPRQWSSR